MAAYFCPMHANVRSENAGKCPVCGMVLVGDQSRFPILEHMLANPVHLAVMALVMVALMAGAMMLMR